MKVFVINGAPGSGKDTFCEYCENILHPYVKIISTVDYVKKVASFCGWNGMKDFKNRKFLSDLKNLLTEWDDIPWKKVKKGMDNFCLELEQFGLDSEKAVLFIHTREPAEIERYKKEYNAQTILIRRDEAEQKTFSNHADNDILNYNYDIKINNNNSLEHLKIAAKIFCERITNL